MKSNYSLVKRIASILLYKVILYLKKVVPGVVQLIRILLWKCSHSDFSFLFLEDLIVQLTGFSISWYSWFLSNASMNSGRIEAFVIAADRFNFLLIHIISSMIPSLKLPLPFSHMS